MSANPNNHYRLWDTLHRILRQVSGSQSTIDPVYGDSPNLPDTFYVDSGNGSDVNDGRDPAAPMATIDAAINRCTASQGDVIIVQPGHTETLTAQISLDVIGVSIIGIGEGTLRPYLTINAAIDGIDIGAANCRVENIGFNEATAAQTAAINIDAANAVVAKCHLDIGANDELGVITVTANGELATIEDNTAEVTANGADEFVLIEGIVDRLIVQRNIILCGGATNSFDIGIVNADAIAATNILFRDNVMFEADGTVPGIVGTALVGVVDKDNAWMGIGAGSVYTGAGDPVAIAGYLFSEDATTGTITLFTITGDVEVVVYGICKDALTTGDGGTAEVGIAGNTAAILPQIAVAILIANEIWHDVTPTTTIENIDLLGVNKFVISNGQDIILTIANNITAGDIDFYCAWKPLSRGANVIAST